MIRRMLTDTALVWTVMIVISQGLKPAGYLIGDLQGSSTWWLGSVQPYGIRDIPYGHQTYRYPVDSGGYGHVSRWYDDGGYRKYTPGYGRDYGSWDYGRGYGRDGYYGDGYGYQRGRGYGYDYGRPLDDRYGYRSQPGYIYGSHPWNSVTYDRYPYDSRDRYPVDRSYPPSTDVFPRYDDYGRRYDDRYGTNYEYGRRPPPTFTDTSRGRDRSILTSYQSVPGREYTIATENGSRSTYARGSTAERDTRLENQSVGNDEIRTDSSNTRSRSGA